MQMLVAGTGIGLSLFIQLRHGLYVVSVVSMTPLQVCSQSTGMVVSP